MIMFSISITKGHHMRNLFKNTRIGIILSLLFLQIITFSCESGNKLKFEKKTISGSGTWIQSTGKEKANKQTAKIIQDKNIINFGVTPVQSDEKMKKAFNPLMKYLSEKTGKKWIFNISPDYNTLRKDLASGNIQVASFSPGAYGEAIKDPEVKNKIRYLITLAKKHKVTKKPIDYYQGYIFTRKSTGIKKISQLKNKTFAFVDKGSSSGYKFPVTMFLKRNINPFQYFKNVFFLGKHDKVTDAVAKKNVVAGATWDGNFMQAKKKHGDVFHILLKTPPIPFDAWAMNKKLSKKFYDKVQKILLNMPMEAKTKAGKKVYHEDYPYKGFVKRSQDFYDIILQTRTLLKKYEKELNKEG